MGKFNHRNAKMEVQEDSKEAGDFWPILWASARRKRVGRAFQAERTTIHKAQRTESALRSRENMNGS